MVKKLQELKECIENMSKYHQDRNFTFINRNARCMYK